MSHGAAVAPPGPKIVQSGEQEGEAAWTGGYKQTNKQTQDPVLSFSKNMYSYRTHVQTIQGNSY